MVPADAAPLPPSLDGVFDSYLPERLSPHLIPQAINAGQILFVAKGDVPRAWQLHGQPDGRTGAFFKPCAADDPAPCRVTMAQEDYLALAQGQLNVQVAFMTGRLKVQGDIACAMQLGALFG
jgi:hypothetical protein